MAADDSKNVELENLELDDKIICCICANVYIDPKALPCVHTFCVNCLQETGLKMNKGPGDEMPCPICRRQFKIPAEGFCGLPNNFFIAKLIEVANVSNLGLCDSSKAFCDACLDDNEGTGTDIPEAIMYCTECKQKLCDECCSHHRKLKLTKNHKLMQIKEQQVGSPNEVLKGKSVCELHEKRFLEIFCAECKTVECAVCFIDGHKQHNGSHVSKCVDGFRKQIGSNIETLNQCSSQIQMKKAELIKIKEDMHQRVERLQEDIMKRRDELKQFADSQANSLLHSLSSLRQSKLKEIQLETDDIDAHLSCLQSYSSHCQKMMAKGSSSDICRAVSDLSVKTAELQEQCQSLIERKIESFKCSFTKSEFEKFLEDDNLIGEIEEERNTKQRKASGPASEVALIRKQSKEINLLKDAINMERREKEVFRLENEQLKLSVSREKRINKILQVENNKLRQESETQRKAMQDFLKRKEQATEDWENTKKDALQFKWDPVLVKTIRIKAAEKENKWILGMTILDKELFVVSDKSSEVEIYDSMKFSFSRRWILNELIDPVDIGSCSRNKCLFIMNSQGETMAILRVDPNGKLIMKWSTEDDHGGSLSVTNESNIILAVSDYHKIQEYSPDGKLIREINLGRPGPELFNPFHAIKLANGYFVVSHGYSDSEPHRVCVVDAEGKLKKAFGGECGSAIGQMNCPVYLSVYGNGFVMVVDQRNSRVLLLDSDLKLQTEVRHELRNPRRILLDESNGRLFVADNESNNQRILIFNYK